MRNRERTNLFLLEKKVWDLFLTWIGGLARDRCTNEFSWMKFFLCKVVLHLLMKFPFPKLIIENLEISNQTCEEFFSCSLPSRSSLWSCNLSFNDLHKKLQLQK
jgi:hypothetical protein